MARSAVVSVTASSSSSRSCSASGRTATTTAAQPFATFLMARTCRWTWASSEGGRPSRNTTALGAEASATVPFEKRTRVRVARSGSCAPKFRNLTGSFSRANPALSSSMNFEPPMPGSAQSPII